ncbi:hypothetical protein PTT_08275 [Pyrenophora teres f. teres 0-1]|uniref:Uncharacterized protein n=1 Tax=Pyrenophora teres f. teres (strain 0-1) TaxID=861557 RepID=E3RJF2_PYRTT|nr:hypothetical protein PTT_08275 [Pyrenophora teres f. teres 0-1]
MKKSPLRKTLLSLLGLAPHLSRAQTTTAATSSWGTPFTVDTPSSASTDALLPSTQQTRSSAAYASFLTPPASTLATVPTGLAIDTAPPVLSRATVTPMNGTTSRVSGSSSSSEEITKTSASVAISTTTTEGVRSTITLASASAQATGAAGGRGYRKMGFVGAVAGAAGVMAW